MNICPITTIYYVVSFNNVDCFVVHFDYFRIKSMLEHEETTIHSTVLEWEFNYPLYQEFINQECSTEYMLIFQFIVFLKVL